MGQDAGMRVVSGRSALLERVADGLKAPDAVGVVLVGEAGIGKTVIAREVSRRLQDAAPLITVRGSTGLRAVPYGALSPYLTELSPADTKSPSTVLRHFMRAVTAELRTQEPPVILIDDAYTLDEESALLVIQLATARKVRILATARRTPGSMGEFSRAAKDGLLAYHPVEPLSLPDVRELSEQILGGSVLTGTARMLAATARGNPLLLTMLLGQLREQGYLVAENGVWRSRGVRPAIGAQLADFLLHGLGTHSAAELAVLETVAVEGRVPLAVLEADTERGVLGRLAQERLIDVAASNGQLVSLRHPLHAEALRVSVPAARLLDRAETARAAMPEPPSDPWALMSWVESALRTSSPIEDPVLLRAARVANRLHHPRLALDALKAVRGPARTPSYLLEAAWVQEAAGNRLLARALLDEAFPLLADPSMMRDGTVLSLRLRRHAREKDHALQQDVERWAALLDAEAARGDSRPEERDTARASARLARASADTLNGNFAGAVGPESSPPRTGLPDEVHLGHLTLLAHALTGSGRPQAASRVLQEAESLLEGDPEHLLTYRDQVFGEHLISLVVAGAWEEARVCFHRSFPADRGTFHFSGWLDVIDGSRSLRTGRFREAREHLVLAVEAFRDTDDAEVLDWVAGAAAYACARAGDVPGAEALIEAHGPLKGGSDAVARRMGGAYVEAALGHLGNEGAVNRLRRIAARAENRHSLLVAATALEHAAVLGDRTALGPLAEVTRAFDGEAGIALHRFAAAAAAGDRDALVLESEACRQRGHLALAIQCLEEAAVVGPAGESARGIHRKLAALRGEVSVVPGVGAALPVHEARLTRGELAIVKQVAAGYTNREIAEIRGISTRTVEGHLYRIFAKLGISRREALQQPDAPL